MIIFYGNTYLPCHITMPKIDDIDKVLYIYFSIVEFNSIPSLLLSQGLTPASLSLLVFIEPCLLFLWGFDTSPLTK